ncbi:MAG: hypothetical protein HQL54_04525 [Magnetococcales bacterium]|nr:hypothetical protein [Magnetococcales bacterium]
MAHAYVEYRANGATTDFQIPFPFLSRDHISVTIDEIVTSDFEWLDDATIRLITLPNNGKTIRIQRLTSTNSRMVAYQTGADLNQDLLNTDSQQAFYLAQEAIDHASERMTQITSSAIWEGKGNRMTNLSPAVDTHDAVTLGQIQPFRDEAIAAAAEAKAHSRAATWRILSPAPFQDLHAQMPPNAVLRSGIKIDLGDLLPNESFILEKRPLTRMDLSMTDSSNIDMGSL